MFGFKIYQGIEDIKYMPLPEREFVEVDRVSKGDDILDIIFALDPLTHLPNTSIGAFLSDKTNDQVRQFIKDNILRDLPDTGVSVPDSLRSDLLSLDPEFIAQISRDRFEDVEHYERRVSDYLESMKQKIKSDHGFVKLLEKYNKEHVS